MCTYLKDTSCKQRIKMNGIVNKFSLVGDKSLTELDLKQPGFTYSAFGRFTKNENSKIIEKVMQTGDTKFIYKNKLDKACFQYDIAYGKTKDLVILFDGYQRGLASIVYTFFDKKSASLNKSALLNKFSVSGIVNEPNYQLAYELHKSIIRKF